MDEDAEEQQTDKMNDKNGEKNQTKPTRKQGKHKDEEGRESLPLLPGKAAQGGRENPTKEVAGVFFSEKREKL